jgi:endonuclease/exonuclease/phosphatase family metal-dependent hydrolase
MTSARMRVNALDFAAIGGIGGKISLPLRISPIITCMQRRHFLTTAFAATAHLVARGEAPLLEALTFNIRYPSRDDGLHYWPKRVALAGKVIAARRYSVIGLQEALRGQLDDLADFTKAFFELGVGRDDGKAGGEYSALLLRKSDWTVEQSGTFWLSDTPEVPGSMTWGNACPRVCTWAQVQATPANPIGQGSYLLANTHWDNASEPARLGAADLMAQRLPLLAKERPMLLFGDFNCSVFSPALKQLQQTAKLRDAFSLAHPKDDGLASGTVHFFKGNVDGPKIDHILHTKHWRTEEVEILHTKENDLWPSDHFPVRWAGRLAS